MLNRLLKLNWMGRFFSLMNISRWNVFTILSLSLLFSIFEGFGISLLLPILQYVDQGDAVFQGENINLFWSTVLDFTQAFDLPLHLGTLLAIAFTPILIRAVVFFYRTFAIAKLHQDSMAYLRQQLFSKYIDADYEHTEKLKEGNIINALTLESHRAGNTVFVFFQFVASSLILFSYAFVLLILSLELTLLAVATFAVMQFFIMRQIRLVRKMGQDVTENNERYNFFITQRIAASKLIRIFKTEEVEKKNLTDHAYELADSETGVQRKLSFVQAMLEPTLIAGAFVILYVAVTTLGMNLPTLGIFLLVLIRVLPLSKTAVSMLQQLISFKPSLDLLEEYLNKASEARLIESGSTVFKGLKNAVEFQNVTFSYDKEKLALNDVSFRLPSSSVLALVGHSGSGKSTIVDLFLRIRDIQNGKILIDGKSIKDFDIESYRRSIGFVSQDTFLFNDTIFNNIAYGKDVAPEAVEKASKLAHCYEFIQRLPQGLQTLVGDRGTSLSGGERQRVCLARALVANPDILILDEPTSALDSESERLINETIQELKTLGKTIIIIAHRFSTVKGADQILVLDCGEVKQSGSHESLMNESNSVYRYLYELQNIDNSQKQVVS